MQLKPSALAGWVLFCLLLFLSIFYSIVGLALPGAASAALYGFLGLVVILAFGLPAYLLKRSRPLQGIVNLRIHRIPRHYYGFVLSGAFCLTFLSYVLHSVFALLQRGSTAALAYYYPVQPGLSRPLLWIGAVSLALVPALMEEFLLRGAIFSLYERRGTMTALLLSSAAFSMLHASPETVAPALAAGFGYGFLLYTTNSIWAPILAHLCNNLYAFFVTVLAAQYTYNAFWAYFTAANVVLFFLFAYIFLRILRNLTQEQLTPSCVPGPGGLGQALGGALRSTGFLLFCGLFALRLILSLLGSRP